MKFTLDKIYLILIFYISPLIDALSGYLILSEILPSGGAGSPSQLFRLTIISLSIFILLKNRKYFYIAMFSIFYIILIESIFFNIHTSIFGYIIGVIYGSKLIYLLLLFLTLYYLYRNNEIDFNSLLKYIQKYVLVMALLLIIPFSLGIGFNTYYEGTFGTKGFFAAGNGLGIFMGVGIMLSVYYWQYTRSKYSLLISIIIIFATVIIGTKTAFIFSLTGLLSIVLYLKSRYISYFILVTVTTLIIFYYQEITDSLEIIFDVIFLRLQNNDSFISFLMSNRDVYFQDAISSICYDGMYILRLVFGFGVYVSFRDPLSTLQGMDTLESDFADIFFMYGLLVLFMYIFILIKINIRFLLKKQFFLGLVFLMLSLHSLLAGHVLFNGMSGLMLPFLILLALTFKQNKKIRM